MTKPRPQRRHPRTFRLAVIGAVALTAFAAATTAALAESDPSPSADPTVAPSSTMSPPPHASDAPSAPVDEPSSSGPGAATPSGSPSDSPSATVPVPAGKFRAATTGAVANSYIVVLKNAKATQSQVSTSATDLTKAHHGKVGKVYSRSLRGFSVTMTENDAKQLAADPNVAYVEQNHLVHKTISENTETSSADGFNLWGLDRVNQAFLPLDHTYGYGDVAATVHAYVIDTGVDIAHSDLAASMPIAGNWSATWGADQIAACGANTDGHDDNGHGTHVAGLLGGKNFGVAKFITMHSVKVLDCSGSGTVAEVVEGVEHVTATFQSPAVANMSLGGPASQAIDDAVNASIASGVTYVVAAGNENTNACTDESPARVSGAITVGATDITDFRASFSNYGPCVDIFAPGVNIESAYPYDGNGNPSNTGYAYASGTSMASPLVAGEAAILLQYHPNWTPAQVGAAIVGTGITGTVHAAGAGTTTKLLRVGEPDAPTTFGLRSHANNRIVTAEAGGAKPMIANRYNVGGWEGITLVDLGNNQVALKSSANGRYITADGGGSLPLIANRTSIGQWEKFTLIHNSDGSVSLQAAINGKYVTAENGGASSLIARGTSIGQWEEFNLAGPAATIFLLSVADSAIVTAENGGTKPLIANRFSVGAWELFDVVDAGGYAAFVAHANGRIVCADKGGASSLIANRTSIGDWEKFTLVNNPDGTLSFLAHANGKYVTAENGGTKPLIANRAGIGGWEEFWLYTEDELS